MKKNYKAYEKPKMEQDRLDLQTKNGSKFTQNIIEKVFEEIPKDAVVMDFGCFNGNSTKTFFSQNENQCKRIIGLDFVADAIEQANKDTHDGKYKFIFADLESSDLEKIISDCLKVEGKKYIDIAFISYVLLHLKKPEKLLKLIAKFSDCNTVVIIKDTDDALKICYPGNEILQEEIEVYSRLRLISRYSDRFIGRKIPKMLMQAGFKNVECFQSKGTTLGKTLKERRDQYEVDFSYREYPDFPEVDTDTTEFQALNKRNKELLRKIKKLFEKDDFFYLKFTFTFIAKK